MKKYAHNPRSQDRRTFLGNIGAGIGAGGTLLMGGLVAGCTPYMQSPEEVSTLVISRATSTLQSFRKDKALQEFDRHLPHAAGVVIIPDALKGGFLFGIGGGTAVLMGHNLISDKWSAPAFYRLGKGSFGLQAGVRQADIVMIIRSRNALKSLIANQGMAGLSIDVTIGQLGNGHKSGVTSNIGTDMIAYIAPGFGLYGGLTVEGSTFIRSKELNRYYYGNDATPEDIVLYHKYQNPRADTLRTEVANYH